MVLVTQRQIQNSATLVATLKQSTWKNEAGENRSAFVIEINEFRVCERLNGNGKNKQQSTKAPASETVPPDSSEGVDYGADNDVPF